MKTIYYFEHYSNLHNTPFGIEIRRKFGWEGYGLVLGLFEELLEQPERKLKLDIKTIAYNFRFDSDSQIQILTDIIHTIFQSDGEYFWSEYLDDLMQLFDKNIESASKGGIESANRLTPEQRKERAKRAGIKSGEVRRNKKDNELTPLVHRTNQELTPLVNELTPLPIPVPLPIPLPEPIPETLPITEKEKIEKEKIDKETADWIKYLESKVNNPVVEVDNSITDEDSPVDKILKLKNQRNKLYAEKPLNYEKIKELDVQIKELFQLVG